MYDCIIVGAGPAGGTAAYHLAKKELLLNSVSIVYRLHDETNRGMFKTVSIIRPNMKSAVV